MTTRFLSTALLTSVVLFILNALVYVLFLDRFFHEHPAISMEFMKQLYRPQDQLILWAVVLSSLAIGILVTLVIDWSGARTPTAGLWAGFKFAFLFLCAVDMGLLGTTNNFTIAGAFADLIFSTTTLALGSAFAAWMLGRGRTVQAAPTGPNT